MNQKMKREGLRVKTLLSQGEISCRMYQDGAGAVNGFSKNVCSALGRILFISISHETTTHDDSTQVSFPAVA